MESIKKNTQKIVYFTVILTLLLMPFFNYFYYNYVSQKTYTKDYFLIQNENFDFLKKVELQNNPIINNKSVKDFAVESVLTLFTYEIHNANKKLSENQNLFSTNLAYETFKNIFEYRVNDEDENGYILKETVITDGPFVLGTFQTTSFQAWRLYMTIKEMRYGENGEINYSNKKIFIIVKTNDFNKKSRGISIDSINIM